MMTFCTIVNRLKWRNGSHFGPLVAPPSASYFQVIPWHTGDHKPALLCSQAGLFFGSVAGQPLFGVTPVLDKGRTHFVQFQSPQKSWRLLRVGPVVLCAHHSSSTWCSPGVLNSVPIFPDLWPYWLERLVLQVQMFGLPQVGDASAS